MHHLVGRNFWEVKVKANASWSWRKILELRDEIQKNFRFSVGNGRSISAWFDTWCDVGPLTKTISNRDIMQAGWNLKSKLADVCSSHGFRWPSIWLEKYPVLNQINVPVFQVCRDKLLWISNDGGEELFSAARAWEAVRHHGQEVDWCDVVWNSANIPRHSFILWLLILRKLKTQDRVQEWEKSRKIKTINCVFCNAQQDSHDHLFFDCGYTKQFWSLCSDMVKIPTSKYKWEDILGYLKPRNMKNSAWGVAGRMVFAAAVYFVWKERNNRLFNKGSRSVDSLFEATTLMVKMKMSTLDLHKLRDSMGLTSKWHI